MRSRLYSLVAVCLVALLLTFARDAHAVGTFKLKSTEANEVSQAWHIYVTVELPKPPLTAHQPMKFLFTKTVVYERSLVDGSKDPVNNRQVVNNSQPSVESLDVDFADPTGKIFKGTRFDFGLTRARGYEAGEYKVEVRTNDGVTIGTGQNLILKGDNPVVDRRSIAFNAKEPSIKKIEGYDGGAKSVAQNDDPPSGGNPGGNGEVTASGTAKPFIPPEGHQKTPEEEIKTRPKGCGCDVPAVGDAGVLFWLVPLAGIGAAVLRRRRSPGRRNQP